MQFDSAVRKATPVVVSLAGKSGSGKTLSALYMARGLAGPDGRVFVIDTENKRSLIYADDPTVGGFQVGHLYPPFTPASYIDAIETAEEAGAEVIVIDSMSHEWSGIGGCLEWADSLDPAGRLGPLAWGKVKAGHRRLVNRLLLAQCHVIVCLRADYKLVAFRDDKGKQQFAESTEVVPEQEKRFVYEMTASAVIDHETHQARWVKLPLPLQGHLADGALIGIDTGDAIRSWVEGGAAIDRETERQLAICREVASRGTEALRLHYGSILKATRDKLKPFVDDLRAIATEADRLEAESQTNEDEPPAGTPEDDPFGGAAPAPVEDEWQPEFDDLAAGLDGTPRDGIRDYLDQQSRRIKAMCEARPDLANRWLQAVDAAFEKQAA